MVKYNIDTKFNYTFPTANLRTAQVLLVGDNGTNYNLLRTGEWVVFPFNSTFIEVQDFRPYNLHGSTEHKMEKFFK